MMAVPKTKQWVNTIKRRLAIMQMFPDGTEPNQRVLSEIFDMDRSAINVDMKCIRAVRAEIAGLSAQYEEKLANPAPARSKPVRRQKWGRRTATVWAGKTGDFKNQAVPERKDDGPGTQGSD
jgi:hypothetical protein